MISLIRMIIALINVMISVDGFNLDVDNVKELKAETDKKGALFGYSLAFYRDDQNRYFKIKFTILKVRSLKQYMFAVNLLTTCYFDYQ